MRYLLITGFCLASLSFSSLASASEPAREPSLQKLAGVSYFAFGPVGTGELPSLAENEFRDLCKKEYAEAYFVELFQRGTAEGKCYALVGLRELSSEYFVKYSDAFKRSAPGYIHVISGRFLRQAPASEILAEIEAGQFAGYLRSKQA